MRPFHSVGWSGPQGMGWTLAVLWGPMGGTGRKYQQKGSDNVR